MSNYTLRNGETYLITTYGTSTTSLGSVGGSAELFGKVFHSNIIVESQDNTVSKFKGDLYTHQELRVSGSMFINKHLTVSGSSTISSLDLDTVILVTTTSGAVTLTLPTTPANTQGRIYFIKKIGGTNTLTLDPSGTTKIDGVSTLATTDASASIQLMSSGVTATGYYIISQYGTWT